MIKVEVLRSAHELDRIADRWRELANAPDATLFQNYELNRFAAEFFASRETPNVVLAESDSGLAIIPAVRRERELGLIGETLFDYRNVLSAGDPGVLKAAFDKLADEDLPLEVTALRGNPIRDQWQSLNPFEFCMAPGVLRYDTAPDTFVREHKKLARAGRRIASKGLVYRRRDKGLEAVAEWVYRRKAEWTGHSENLFLDRTRQDFMLHVVLGGLLPCSIYSYETPNGEIAAALVTFSFRDRRHFYTNHFDQRWAYLSPGQVMMYEVTRDSLSEGLDCDYMTGEYPYKNRTASHLEPLYRVYATPEQLANWQPASAATRISEAA